jgi:hypothetical protein
MKKLLTVLLVVAMTMTMALSVSAAEPVLNEETGITSIQLLSCDEKPSGKNAYSVDTTDKQEGEGSLSFRVGGGQVNEMNLPETVNGEGMDTLEFDLYLSDVGLLDLFNGTSKNSGFELTSSGYWDNQEISWTLSQIKANNQGGEIVNGWNHIILPLDSAVERESDGNRPGYEGPFNIEDVKFIRFFMVGEQTDHDITVKIDNICLTDWNAVTTAAKKEALAKEKATEFVTDVLALAEVTAENYTTIKTDVEALRTRYNKLNDIAKDYVTKAAKDKLEAAEAKIAEFEANPPSQTPDTGDNAGDNGNTGNTGDSTGSGCGATVALGSVAMMVMAVAMGGAMLKKREN